MADRKTAAKKGKKEGRKDGNEPHDGAHALADARMPAAGGMKGEASMRDIVRTTVSCRARHRRTSDAKLRLTMAGSEVNPGAKPNDGIEDDDDNEEEGERAHEATATDPPRGREEGTYVRTK